MMKRYLPALLVLLASCSASNTLYPEVDGDTNSVNNSSLIGAEADTTGLWTSPVKVTNIAVFKSKNHDFDHPNSCQLNVSFTNTSAKIITSITFTCYGITNDGKYRGLDHLLDADQVIPASGNLLLPGQSIIKSWTINNSSIKRVINLYPVKVSFKDDGVWMLN